MIRISQIDDELSIYVNNTVVLLGLGNGFKQMFDLLQYHGIEVNCICDNNKDNWGQTRHGLNVISPPELKKMIECEDSNVVVQVAIKDMDKVTIDLLSNMGAKSVISFDECFDNLFDDEYVKLSNISKFNNIEESIARLNDSINSITDKQNQIVNKLNNNNKILNENKRATNEILWAQIFNNSISCNEWLIDKAFSPGRWAIGYQALYVLFRILNEVKPLNILELGLGQSTRLIGQYTKHYENVNHHIVESNEEWIDFFSNNFKLSNRSKIHKLDVEMTSFNDIDDIRTFKDFYGKFKEQKFDLILIDAPVGGDMSTYSRIDILNILPSCLDDSFVILQDDGDRKPEKNTLNKIEECLNTNDIEFEKGIYSGKRDLVVLTSNDLKFVTSM